MVFKVGINGYGRTGRQVLRIAFARGIPVSHINDCNMTLADMVYLTKYDTVHGRFQGTVDSEDGCLVVNGHKITVSSEKEPSNIPWSGEYVSECTGVFLTKEKCQGHLTAGAKKVAIAAPPKDDTPLFVCGVNLEEYRPEMEIVSNSSCNTNCLAILCKVLEQEFGIQEGLMTTVHSLTGTQAVVDSSCARDKRRGRCASANVSPTTTGAAKSVAKVIPSLKGKMNGLAFRVPTIDVCIIDLTVKLLKPTSIDEIVDKITMYQDLPELKGLLGFTRDEIVSSDVIGNPLSCLFDVGASIALSDTFFKLICWTDNEHAYSNRMLDLMTHMAQ
ncbi:glyceraldehyde-3-phosphate dehydrogenase 1 [Gorgonomyces haynaldii]|nr:glyceraldehyde-3-phosphate dehydrogenase 1 [Gorgonomyces haynaldii]